MLPTLGPWDSAWMLQRRRSRLLKPNSRKHRSASRRPRRLSSKHKSGRTGGNTPSSASATCSRGCEHAAQDRLRDDFRGCGKPTRTLGRAGEYWQSGQCRGASEEEGKRGRVHGFRSRPASECCRWDDDELVRETSCSSARSAPRTSSTLLEAMTAFVRIGKAKSWASGYKFRREQGPTLTFVNCGADNVHYQGTPDIGRERLATIARYSEASGPVSLSCSLFMRTGCLSLTCGMSGNTAWNCRACRACVHARKR